MRRFSARLLLPLVLLAAVGCNDFERNTFKTLSASKAVLDDAQVKYEAGTALPHNSCAFTIINDGKAAQTIAVNAMLNYESVKAAKGDLTSITSVVTLDLVALAPLVVKIESLIANPAVCKGAK